MVGQFRLQRSLQDCFRELFQKAVFADDVFRLFVISQQLVNKCLVDGHRFLILLFRWSFTQSLLHPRFGQLDLKSCHPALLSDSGFTLARRAVFLRASASSNSFESSSSFLWSTSWAASAAISCQLRSGLESLFDMARVSENESAPAMGVNFQHSGQGALRLPVAVIRLWKGPPPRASVKQRHLRFFLLRGMGKWGSKLCANQGRFHAETVACFLLVSRTLFAFGAIG